jgi:hypothetical protein
MTRIAMITQPLSIFFMSLRLYLRSFPCVELRELESRTSSMPWKRYYQLSYSPKMQHLQPPPVA